MRRLLFLSLVMAFAVSLGFSQTRQQAIEELDNLKIKAQSLEAKILEPSIEDINTATAEGLNVFRILPREKYDTQFFKVRGGGAYYSFTKKSHSYNETPQIELQQDKLMVGFAGVDYGFINDLGKTSIDLVNQTKEFKFASKYKPSMIEKEARFEKAKFEKYEENGMTFQRSVSYEVGNTYLLRAISYDEADILVVFKIQRQDSDGSLIIFWKHLKDFEIPNLERAEAK